MTACRGAVVRAAGLLAAAALLGGCLASSHGAADHATDGAGAYTERSPYWDNPEGAAERQVDAYRASGQDRRAELTRHIAERPVAEWLGAEHPEAEARTYTTSAQRAGKRAVLVLYNLPHRDCGQYSGGGASDAAAYRSGWRRF